MRLGLRTPRLILRQWRDEDSEPFAALSVDAGVTRYLVPFDDRAAIDRWIAATRAHWAAHGFGQWAIEIPGEAAFIGAIGLSHVRWPLPFTPAVEVAWRLAPAHWGRGYATEAARAALDDGFYRLGLAEIVAFTVVQNRPSRAVMERLGMTRDPAEDFGFAHPRLPEGHPLHRHVLYRARK